MTSIKSNLLYHRGAGVDRDTAEAARWYETAADAGDALARYNLGMLILGDGSREANTKNAARHIEQAAKQGVTAAQNQIAIMYARGVGVESDRETALAWFEIAAGMGDDQAIGNRNRFAATLSPDARAKAKRRARAFRPQNTSQ